MHVDNLAKAVEVQGQLKLWQQALKRCDHGLFKGATLVVQDAAHGHQGQNAQTAIPLEADHVKWLAEEHIARLSAELRELGVEL